MKTFSLLLTSPVSSWQLVLAKLGLGAVVTASLLGISSILPLSLGLFTDLPLSLILLGYFGTFLLLMVYVSAGVLASAMTDSLIVSVVLALVFSLAILLLGVGREFTQSVFWQEFFNYLAVDTHFSFFRSGSLSVAACLFFISFIGFFAAISERIIEFHRWR